MFLVEQNFDLRGKFTVYVKFKLTTFNISVIHFFPLILGIAYG